MTDGGKNVHFDLLRKQHFCCEPHQNFLPLITLINLINSTCIMGKHATDVDKTIFLTHLLYVHQAKAARRAGLVKSTATDIKNAAADMQVDPKEA
jgi:hypothetical protein